MTTIRVQGFLGTKPKVSPRLLENENSQVADNCNLERGHFQALRTPKSEQSLSGVTVYKFGDRWLTWGKAVDVVKSFVYAENKRFAWTGDDYPKVSDLTLWPSSKRLGVPAPTTAPNVEFNEDPDYEAPETTLTEANFDVDYYLEKNPGLVEYIGTELIPTAWYHYATWGRAEGREARAKPDSVPDETEIAVKFSTAYVYTAVNDWDEESAPSPPSAVVDVRENQIPKVIDMAKPAATGVTIVKLRVYRSASGTKAATYQFVAEVNANESYYVDENEDADLGETCPTVGFTMPPDGLLGLYSASNGLLFGFVGNKLYVSETYISYAFPDDYTVTFEDDIVGVSGYGSTVVVCTEARPYVLTGVNPESLTVTRMPFDMACVSRKSIISSEDSVVYAAPDGLVAVSSSASYSLLTKGLYSKDQWKALGPEKLIGAYYDRRYIGFFEDTGDGFILDMDRGDITTFSLPVTVKSTYYDPTGDTLYLHTGTNLHSWEGETTKLTAEWKSKAYFAKEPITFDCATVSGGAGNTFKYFVDGVERHSQVIVSDEVFRLPGGFLGQVFEFSITGTEEVYEAALATSTQELVANG